MDIHPPAEFLDVLREKVASGEFPSEEAVWREAIRHLRTPGGIRTGDEGTTRSDDAEDWDAIAYCARAIRGQAIPSLEEVRRLSTKIKGSLSRSVIEEREDRF